MKEYSFEVILEEHCLSEERSEEIYQHCLPDGESESDHVAKLGFARRAPDFTSAVCDMVGRLAEVGARAARIEFDDFVGVPEIARLEGRSRESVRLLIAGRRGPGGFPAPEYDSKQELLRFWRWPDVERWFAAYEKRAPRLEDHSDEVAAINAALAVARLKGRLTKEQQRLLDRLMAA